MSNSTAFRTIAVVFALISSACRPAGVEAVRGAAPAPVASDEFATSELAGIGDAMTAARPPLSLVLNVPAFRLDAFLHDTLVRSFRVAVGMPKYQTPLGSFAIRVIEWNPWWHPPESEWAAKEKVTPPGPDNPMGRVKLYMRPLYFLHGTPFEGSVGSAASHGCIRLRNDEVIELARLVHRFGNPSMSEADIDNLSRDLEHTRRVAVERPIPIAVRYDRVEVRGDQVRVFPDIYRKSPALTAGVVLAAMARSGIEESRVDQDRVRSLIERAQRGGGRASMPLDTLLTAPSRN